MDKVINRKIKTHSLENIELNVAKIYSRFPINKKFNPKANQVNYIRNYFHNIYCNKILPLRLRTYIWQLFRKAHLDLNWFKEFVIYWEKIIEARYFLDINDFFFFRSLYRISLQNTQLPDTNNAYIHLDAWQQSHTIYQLLAQVSNEAFTYDYKILKTLKKKMKKISNLLEYGCATAPMVTNIFEFLKLPKKIKIYLCDIQTIPFHYAIYKFKNCSNVIPILLVPENEFLLKLNEKFDIIFCLKVFEHLNKPMETIKTFYKLLNSGGLLIFDYIKSGGEGLDSMHSVRERNEILDFICTNFKILDGNISKEHSVGLTIVKKL